MRNTAVLVASCSLAVVSSAHATDRFVPDCTAVSANGRYRFESNHPNNKHEKPEPSVFDGFTFRLIDVQTDKVIWERMQAGRDFAPVSALVSESGWVAGSSGTAFECFEPAAGATKASWDVEQLFSKEDLQHISIRESTAGRLVSWVKCAHGSFITHGSAVYFVTRTWWDRRIWIDLTAGSPLPDPSPELLALSERADREWTIATLRGAAESLEKLSRDRDGAVYWRRHGAVVTAAHLAGKMKLAEAAADLRALQASDYSGRSTGGRGQLGADGVDPLARVEYTLRQHCHLALRRIGERPDGLPCNAFWLPSGQTFPPRVSLPGPREEAASAIIRGMEALMVLKGIGAPDVVREVPPAMTARWEYDMDGADPFTLVIEWQDGKAVRVERQRPVAWRDGLVRDESLCKD